MSDLQIFRNPEFGQVRSLVIDDQPWFVGKDVCDALGYANSRKAISTHVDDSEKGVTKVTTSGGLQDMIIVNESGLYALAFGSELKEARRFRKWVTSEVLPTIRKTGSYGTPLDCMGAAQMILQASNKQLPFVVSLLRQQGFDLPELPKRNRWADRAETTELRNLMTEHHVSLNELVRRTGICKTSLWNYMIGEHRPSAERYEIIVQAITM